MSINEEKAAALKKQKGNMFKRPVKKNASTKKEEVIVSEENVVKKEKNNVPEKKIIETKLTETDEMIEIAQISLTASSDVKKFLNKYKEIKEENKKLEEENEKLKKEVEQKHSHNPFRKPRKRVYDQEEREVKISVPIRADLWDRTRFILRETKQLTLRTVLIQYIEAWMDEASAWFEKQEDKENAQYVFDTEKYSEYDFSAFERKRTGFNATRDFKQRFSTITKELNLSQAQIIEAMCEDIIRDVYFDKLQYDENKHKIERKPRTVELPAAEKI